MTVSALGPLTTGPQVGSTPPASAAGCAENRLFFRASKVGWGSPDSHPKDFLISPGAGVDRPGG